MTREIFQFLAVEFDITKARKLLEGRPAKNVMRPADCRTLLNLIRIEEDHWPTVDLTQPVLMATLPDYFGGHLLIDGWHRVRRALEENVHELPCHILSLKETKKICITERGINWDK